MLETGAMTCNECVSGKAKSFGKMKENTIEKPKRRIGGSANLDDEDGLWSQTKTGSFAIGNSLSAINRFSSFASSTRERQAREIFPDDFIDFRQQSR